jgi:hypothetical protein
LLSAALAGRGILAVTAEVGLQELRAMQPVTPSSVLCVVTLSACGIAALTAAILEAWWVSLVGTGSTLLANLPIFLALDFGPLLAFTAVGVIGRKRSGLPQAACACSVLAAGLWLFALATPVTDSPDPEWEVGMLGFCVKFVQCLLTLPLTLALGLGALTDSWARQRQAR